MRLNPFGRRGGRGRGRASRDESWLTPRAKRAIAGIILLVVSIIAILSFFQAAGPTGEVLLDLLRRVFGYLAYMAPLAGVALGLHLVWPQLIGLERLRVLGLSLATVGLLGLLHIIGIATDDALQAAAEGRGGGYLGFMLSFPLGQAVSRVAAGLIFAGALLVGLILTSRVSPADVWEAAKGAWARVTGAAGKGDGVEEEVAERPRFSINMMSASDPREAEPEAAGVAGMKAGEAARHMRVISRRYRPAILDKLTAAGRVGARDKDLERHNKETIKRKLEQFGIGVEMGDTNVGPTVTRYTLRPDEGTKLTRITALQDDLALALAAHPIRIEAPIPNTNLVGIEIPNKIPALVRLRDLLESKAFKNADSPLTFPLGKDVSGHVVVDTLERLPHMLIAGATGAGKSVNIHTLMVAWLLRNSPDVVRFILIDPKRVELSAYNMIPHLLAPVIVDTDKAINSLKWALDEMDTRYRLLEESGARNLLSYNMSNAHDARPYIVIIIDELADLMVKHGREIEGPVVRLSQMARAVGIHLVLATQRPSVNVLTGLIKANVPARLAFSVASQVDSRTILDMAGAEKLVGNGDMLYLAGDKARPVRLQGGFVSEDEVRKVVAAVRETGAAAYEEAVVSPAQGKGVVRTEEADDPLLEEAQRVVVRSDKASASLLQRRLRVGYARAARLLDMLEERGVVGVAEGNKPRPVLIREAAEQLPETPDAFAGEETALEIDEGEEYSAGEQKW